MPLKTHSSTAQIPLHDRFFRRSPNATYIVFLFCKTKHQQVCPKPKQKTILAMCLKLFWAPKKSCWGRFSSDPKSASRPIFATSLKRYKNNGVDSKAKILAPQKHQNHQNHSGFISFFEHCFFATIWPFPATRNPPRDRFLWRRSNVIKIMVWTQIRPLETPPRDQNVNITKDVCKKSPPPYGAKNQNVNITKEVCKKSPPESLPSLPPLAAQPNCPAQLPTPCLRAARVGHFLHWSNVFLMKI